MSENPTLVLQSKELWLRPTTKIDHPRKAESYISYLSMERPSGIAPLRFRSDILRTEQFGGQLLCSPILSKKPNLLRPPIWSRPKGIYHIMAFSRWWPPGKGTHLTRALHFKSIWYFIHRPLKRLTGASLCLCQEYNSMRTRLRNWFVRFCVLHSL